MESTYKQIESSLCVTQVIVLKGHAVERVEMMICRYRVESTTIVRMYGSLLSVMEAVLNYGGTLALWFGASPAEDCIKNIVDDILPSRYLPRQLHFFYVRNARFGRLAEKHSDVFSLLEPLNEGLRKAKS